MAREASGRFVAGPKSKSVSKSLAAAGKRAAAQRAGVSVQKRQELCQAAVTLNGQPAKVTGYGNRFATVTQTATRLSAQWSWEAVERVVANGGAFES